MTIVQNKSGVAGNDQYKANFEAIFGTDEERAERHKLEKQAQAQKADEFKTLSKGAYIKGNFQAFKSPIDGSIIRSSKDLDSHNVRNGVSNFDDYSPAYLSRRATEMYNESRGNTAQAKKERQQLIEKTLYQHGILR